MSRAISQRILSSFIIYQGFKLIRLFAIFAHSRLCSKPLIHVIGDSHVKAFRGIKSLYVIIHHLGAPTAYNLGNRNSTTNSNEKLFKIIESSNRRDIFVLVFGEIDCRLHIYNQYRKNKEELKISELIDRTILNYGDVLERLSQLGISFAVYNVPPAGEQENVHGYPYYASKEIRSMITRDFNEKLKLLCQERGYKFLDIFSLVSDEDGFMRDEYAADGTHLNSKAAKFIVDWFSEEFGVRLDRFLWKRLWQQTNPRKMTKIQ